MTNRSEVNRMVCAETFEVHDDRLTRYLLDLDHEIGRSKARFLNALGFAANSTDALVDALFEQLFGEESAITTVPHPLGYGLTVRVVGPLVGPLGSASVRAVWLRDEGTTTARFITVYPHRSR